jgi:hypothetical protein
LSIIYDALKKSQQARASGKVRVATAVKQRMTRKNVMIILLLLTSIFVITATISITGQLTKTKKLSENKVIPKPKPPAPVAIASAPRLMLEGVFLSENEKLALINHHAYHEGDTVNGMQVINIAFDKVTLKNNTHSIQLRSVMTQLD